MPKLPQFTASNKAGVLNLPEVSPNVYGAGAFQQIEQLGHYALRLDQNLQAQRDHLDMEALDSDYKLGAETDYQAALKVPQIDRQEKELARLLDGRHEKMMKRPMSDTVREAFASHRRTLDTQYIISIRNDGRVQEAGRQIVDTQQTAEARMDQAAKYSQLGAGASNFEIRKLASAAEALVSGLEKNRHVAPVQVQAMRESLQDRYWSEFAREHPDELQAIRAGGPMADRPIGLDWKKLPYYEQIASAERHRLDKQVNAEHAQRKDVTTKQMLTNMYGDGREIPGRDVFTDILGAQDMFDAKEYEHLLEKNQQVELSRQTIIHDSQKLRSSYVKQGLLEQAKLAKFDDGIDLDALEQQTHDHVFSKKYMDLHPDGAGEILTAINDARTHRQSSDTPLRKARTEAIKSLDVIVPMQLDPDQAFTLHAIEDSMKRQLVAELSARPDMTIMEMQGLADDIRAHAEVRILGAQELSMKRLDEVLFGMEQHWEKIAPGIASSGHVLDKGKRAKLEQQYPMLKGLFSIHDQRVKRYESLTKVQQDLANQPVGKKKP